MQVWDGTADHNHIYLVGAGRAPDYYSYQQPGKCVFETPFSGWLNKNENHQHSYNTIKYLKTLILTQICTIIIVETRIEYESGNVHWQK